MWWQEGRASPRHGGKTVGVGRPKRKVVGSVGVVAGHRNGEKVQAVAMAQKRWAGTERSSVCV